MLFKITCHPKVQLFESKTLSHSLTDSTINIPTWDPNRVDTRKLEDVVGAIFTVHGPILDEKMPYGTKESLETAERVLATNTRANEIYVS